jgi:addiction module HigA family antidote
MRTLRNPVRRPTHPGEVLRLDVLPALKTGQAAFAAALGVSRLTVSQLLNGERSLSPEMVLRLEKLLATSAPSWRRMQEAVDLWNAARAAADSLASIKQIVRRFDSSYALAA